VDKIARIGLMCIKNLLGSERCIEVLLDLKFMRTIDILLTTKWSDLAIKKDLNELYDFLDKNYKIMTSFEKYAKEMDNGNLKWGSLHTINFWEDHYKEFEFNNFEYIRKLVRILGSNNEKKGEALDERAIEMKCIACYDLGEFSRLYPGGSAVIEHFGAKDSLMELIKHNNLELKNRALICLQKLLMKTLTKN
jgi:hypothetical protein